MWNSRQNRIVLYASAFILIGLFIYAFSRDTSTLVSLDKATHLVETNQVQKVLVSEEYIYLKTSGNTFKVAASQLDPKLIAGYPVKAATGSNALTLLLTLFIVFVIGALTFWLWLKRDRLTATSTTTTSGSAQGVPMQKVAPVKSDVTFSDIGGISDVKVELEEIIDFLKNPKRYRSFGARMPRGVLLVGPPGVGKTMIAKAVAAEAKAPFYYQSGASFVQIYVGMGAKRVHELFSAAKANAPAIIFIDEIDAVGKKRDGSRNDEREATLNQLLTEMDGFEDTSGVIVVAATNKIDVLDSALLRAGRFDRRIFVDLPTPKEREAILSKYLVNVPNDVSVEEIARMTVGFNGASLAALVNEAALLSLRQNDLRVNMEHFSQVKDKVLFGKKKVPVLTDTQKAYRARYQAGKAFAAEAAGIAFDKVILTSETIKPPMGEPMLQHEIESHIKVLLAGMAACNLKFGEHATNAAEDIEQARELVDGMIDKYAMGKNIIGSDSDKKTLYERLYDETKMMLESQEETLDAITMVLLERESISKEAVEKIVNEVL
ncbi:MAG: AAA family ATPase [Sulfurimonadaceae bacterium]|nr:AAA family ATPase [Sulfurimonadaceae bacterium]